jgi:hypothetical protein
MSKAVPEVCGTPAPLCVPSPSPKKLAKSPHGLEYVGSLVDVSIDQPAPLLGANSATMLGAHATPLRPCSWPVPPSATSVHAGVYA